MNVVEHLVEIVSALNALQIPHLVMGGHAVRYYGFSRETNNHDLCIPTDVGQNLAELLSKTSLFVSAPPTEAPTWRGDDFRRFVLVPSESHGDDTRRFLERVAFDAARETAWLRRSRVATRRRGLAALARDARSRPASGKTNRSRGASE